MLRTTVSVQYKREKITFFFLRVSGSFEHIYVSSDFILFLPQFFHKRIIVATITSERVELYCHTPPQGHMIPLGVHNLLVDDSIPED